MIQSTSIPIKDITTDLTEEEKRAIDQEMACYENRRAAGVEALKIVQEHRGWVSDTTLKSVCAYTGIAQADLEAVATFYNLIFRQPVGRHVIMVCDSVSCWICGYDQLKQQVQDRLKIDFGQTTKDDRFTLLPICCLGHCDHAPALMIDGEVFGDLNAERLNQLLERYQ